MVERNCVDSDVAASHLAYQRPHTTSRSMICGMALSRLIQTAYADPSFGNAEVSHGHVRPATRVPARLQSELCAGRRHHGDVGLQRKLLQW